ncbi:ABC transporter permease [uncultured Alsobacter sp.]|uniref:ABC transporter permease n=1 Tax=uncultured Alsobacter sp. TaxID=1748258 RepID=UPI0025DD3DBB|nr:ABC transporter permease [uncultured Alsobacter sp.]
MTVPAAGTLPLPAARRGADALAAVLVALALCALCLGPFVSLKPNRIAEGEPLMLWSAVSGPAAAAVLGLLLAGLGALATFPKPAVRILAPASGLAAVFAGVIAASATLVPAGDKLARVSPDWGFWLAATCMALALTDSAARARPSPGLRVLAVAVTWLLVLAVLQAGLLDGLSVMREYAVRSEVFWREMARHVALALGSAAAAIALGLPIGLAIHARAGARDPVLAVLTAIQAIPSIALFGLLMAPLAWLAHAVPAVGALGVRGIGAAPAFIALTLYALLPIVAATVTGLAGVPPTAVDAARGAGMTRGQILRAVELPLAFAAVLSGVRVVLVQTIGLTTVAALIGGGGLGTFVFQGLGQTAIDLVLLGTLPIVAMAVTAGILLDAAAEGLRWTP